MATAAAILETKDLTMDFRGFRALDGLDLRVQAGTIHAVIGPNGAGKTTLFNLLSGLLAPTRGRILFAGREITGTPPYRIARLGIARSFQISSVFPHLTLLDNVRLALQASTPLGYAFWRSDQVLDQFSEEAGEILGSVGLAELAGRQVHALGYGQKRALEIGLTLALRPKLLLLDEPTAGLSLEEVSRVVEPIRRIAQDHTVVLVEHNMGVVAALSQRITVLQHGRVLAEGTYEELRTNRHVIEAYLGGAA
ncbi:MAG TPA: ABC transporter ATP-binding protein [bacterium]|nr:ABC transporter ATP-binding protein [bacterium]